MARKKAMEAESETDLFASEAADTPAPDKERTDFCSNCANKQEQDDGTLYCPVQQETVKPDEWCSDYLRNTNVVEESTERVCGTCGYRQNDDNVETGLVCGLTFGTISVSQPACAEWEAELASQDVVAEEPTEDVSITDPSEPGSEADTAPETETKKTKEYLKYVFTREEKEEFAGELARNLGDLEQKKLQKKEVVKAIDSEIAGLESAVSRLVAFVRDGYDWRNVDCEVVLNYTTRFKTTVRLDTLETVKTAPMTADELQRVFDFQQEHGHA